MGLVIRRTKYALDISNKSTGHSCTDNTYRKKVDGFVDSSLAYGREKTVRLDIDSLCKLIDA